MSKHDNKAVPYGESRDTNGHAMDRIAELEKALKTANECLATERIAVVALTEDRDQWESNCGELQQIFDLQHTRTVEADKLWQAAHGKPEVWPDLGELVQWLIGRHDALAELIKAFPVVEPGVYEESYRGGKPYHISASYRDNEGVHGLLQPLKGILKKRAELEG